MKDWRVHKDGWAQAEELGVHNVCKRLGWTTRRLDKELDRVASADAFLANVARALKELDKPRLLHRDPAREPTHIPALAAKGEPEMVPAEYETELARDSREKFNEEGKVRNAERMNFPLSTRLAKVIGEANRKGINVSSDSRAVVRLVERMERRVDQI